MTNKKSDYSLADRAVHRIAFATLPAQVALADMEDKLYAKELEGIEAGPPLFITALPRAGTTLLLELCEKLPEYCSHTYRDMPFLLCPMLWQRFSGRFQREEAPQERAHGDGMMVSTDSAEAFEEVIWKFFWRQHYRDDRIVPWGELHDDEFREFLASHLRKIIALRAPQTTAKARYVSKNNANIARLRGLAQLFPGAAFIVPFRDPLQHAASLRRQHLRFLDVHAEDEFARFYMSAIGHHDFGANLRPLDFDGWLATRRSHDETTLDFWLEYWTACYRHVLSLAGESVHLVSYDRLSESPAAALETLAGIVDASDPALFRSQAERLTPATPHKVDTLEIDPEILSAALHLHDALREKAVV